VVSRVASSTSGERSPTNNEKSEVEEEEECWLSVHVSSTWGAPRNARGFGNDRHLPDSICVSKIPENIIEY
jgi:hypothetical protein